MLVLSRKNNQGIVIGDNIELTILAVGRDRVKIGFNAPAQVPIHRAEVKRRIDAEMPLQTISRVEPVAPAADVA